MGHGEAENPQDVRVRAIAHMHSTHSDGTATVAELRAFARAAGARVVLLTDHDTLGARDAGEDGWGDGVLVVVGHEVTPRVGHLLVFGTDAPVGHAGRDERAILDAVADAGGVAYAAHPFSTGSQISHAFGPAHDWTAVDHPALRGIELWSLTTDVAEAWTSPVAMVRGLRRPAAVPFPVGHLELWAALDAVREQAGLAPLAVLGGQDGHAPGPRIAGRVRSVMPHARWLPLLQTELLLDEPLDTGPEDERRVLDALRAGRTALVVPPLDNGPGAVRTACDGDRTVLWRGDRVWKAWSVAGAHQPIG